MAKNPVVEVVHFPRFLPRDRWPEDPGMTRLEPVSSGFSSLEAAEAAAPRLARRSINRCAAILPTPSTPPIEIELLDAPAKVQPITFFSIRDDGTVFREVTGRYELLETLTWEEDFNYHEACSYSEFLAWSGLPKSSLSRLLRQGYDFQNGTNRAWNVRKFKAAGYPGLRP